GGVGLNRTNVALLGYEAPGATAYVPHWIEIVISVAAIAAGILLFALAVRFLPILPQADGDRTESQSPHWSRRALVFVGGALSLLTIAVVLLLQPLTQAQASKTEPLPEAETASVQVCSCTDCHLEIEALVEAGATQDNLAALQIELQPAEMPHSDISCIACHYGDRTTTETQAAHQDIVRDPTGGEAGVCIACHPDLPEEFPEDRLRTPHDEVTHGEVTDVLCSDCHGAVGHGFDPVSGDVICPMSVCLDCHVERNLDSELSDCAACHIGPHEPVPALECSACHQSTDVWHQVTMDSHPLELVGAHAQAQCIDCHPDLDFELAAGTQCADCHQAPDADHYGPNCEDCHSPAGFADARLPAEMHPFPLQGAHQYAACEGCHAADQSVPEFVCSNCHDRPENHLPGECSLCHTPEGWAQSIAYVVNLSPQISHELEGRQDCLMCHSVDGEIAPAPNNHGDYINEQCTLCHKTP
ncbi:MAG: cytochrome c3 family protein, partial [Anaerolineae bacterium]